VVGEGAAFSGMAVVQLVRMQHQHLPRVAGVQATAVVELLDAAEREADSVRLVSVRVEGMPAEARGHALQAGGGSIESDAVEAHARTFKTVTPPCPIWAA
jgi:hypothetical protein